MEPREYKVGEIRTFRIFIALLFGIAVLSGIGGLVNLDKWPEATPEIVQGTERGDNSSKLKDGKWKGKSTRYMNVPLAYFLASATFLALSVAGGLGVRRVIKNNLRDVELDPVAASNSPNPTDRTGAAR